MKKYFIGWMFGLLVSANAKGSELEDLAALCRNGHLQSRQNVRTIQCIYEINRPARKATNPYDGSVRMAPEEKVVVEWWQDGDMFRSSEHHPNDYSADFLWKNDILKTLRTQGHRPPDSKWSGQIETDKALPLVQSPWKLALFGWPDKMPFRLESPILKSINLVEIEGYKCYCAVTRWENGRGEKWFDIRNNFLVRKTVLYPKLDDDSSWYAHEVASFREWQPGIYFPEIVSYKRSAKGIINLVNRVVFKDVRINESIDPEVFHLTFPEGTSVGNVIKGTRYTVGANEEPIDSPHPLEPPRNSTEVQYPTGMNKAWTGTHFLIIAGCFAGVVGMGVFVWRKFRKKAVI